MSTALEQPEQPGACCPACGTVVAVQPSPNYCQPVPCPSCRHRLWFLRRTVGDVVVLRFLATASEGGPAEMGTGFRDDARLAIGDSTRVVANLGELSRVDCGILNDLLIIWKRLAASGGQLRVCGLRPPIAEIFRLFKLDKVLAIDDDEGQALKRLRETPH